MRGATLDRPLWSTFSKKPINQSRRERITATDAIEYLQVLSHRRLVKLATGIANSTPVVDCRGLRIPQRRRHDLEVWKLGHGALDHAMKSRDVELRMMLVLSFDFETERGSEVFFITDHHVNKRRQLAINRNR